MIPLTPAQAVVRTLRAGRGARAVLNRLRPLAAGALALLLLSSAAAHAEGDVTDCTEDALLAALDGGGAVTFIENCSITLSAPLEIAADTTLDAQGFQVTISGGNLGSVFLVDKSVSFTGIGLTITGGSNTTGGAFYIQTNATVLLTNCVLTGNNALGRNGGVGANGSTNINSGGKGADGSPGTQARGGAIFNQGNLTLQNCLLLTNSALGGNGGNGGNGGAGGGNGGDGGNGAGGGAAYGGAIYNLGTLLLSQCTIATNTVAGGIGGAGGTSGAGAFPGLPGSGAAGGPGSGAGIYSTKPFTVIKCTFAGNTARGGNSAAGGMLANGTGQTGPAGATSQGGGIYGTATAALTNCTFFRNTATGGNGGAGGNGTGNSGDGGPGGNGVGGGFYTASSVFVVNCTIANCNAIGGAGGPAGTGVYPAGKAGAAGAAQGGGIANGGGTFTLKNSILSTNLSGLNAYGTITDKGYNLSSDSTPSSLASTNKNKNARLGVLANNGGPTMTMAILSAASPAYNKIPATSAGLPPTDQRGVARPGLGKTKADIGAYEVAPPLVAAPPLYSFPTNGGPVKFSLSVIGDLPLHYQWRLNGTNLLSATNSTYAITSVTNGNAGPYSTAVTNGYGSVTSATVVVQFAPSVILAPTNQTVAAGSNVTLAVTTAGTTSGLSYYWQFYGTNAPRGTQTTVGYFTNAFAVFHTNVLALNNAQLADSGTYSVVVSNAFGSVTSAVAALTVQALPDIVTEPAGQSVVAGANATFAVVATGSSLGYQWHFNGSDLSGATQSSYTRVNAQTNNAGSYTVTVFNGLGGEDSFPPAVLKVLVPPQLTAARSAANTLSLVFQSQPNTAYVVEYKDNLASTNAWTPVSTNNGTGLLMSNQFSTTNPPSRFFRVRAQ